VLGSKTVWIPGAIRGGEDDMGPPNWRSPSSPITYSHATKSLEYTHLTPVYPVWADVVQKARKMCDMWAAGRAFDGFWTRFWALPNAKFDLLLVFCIAVRRSLFHFWDYCRQSAKLYIFLYTSLVFHLGSQDIVIWLSMHVAKTSTCPLMCLFPLFAAPCDPNPPMLQTDGRTEGLMSCS